MLIDVCPSTTLARVLFLLQFSFSFYSALTQLSLNSILSLSQLYLRRSIKYFVFFLLTVHKILSRVESSRGPCRG